MYFNFIKLFQPVQVTDLKDNSYNADSHYYSVPTYVFYISFVYSYVLLYFFQYKFF